jgi:hypothetical protein
MSPLRPAHPSTMADWMFCLRSDADDIPRGHALLMRKNEIASYRLAVLIDGCAREVYRSYQSRRRLNEFRLLSLVQER